MDPIRSNARRAGLLYLSLALIAPISLSYAPGQLAAGGGATAANVAAHAGLLRLSLGASSPTR